MKMKPPFVEGYNCDNMRKMAVARGYVTDRAIMQAIQRELGIRPITAEKKFYEGNYSFEDSFVIASFFEMTPKEYCDCFLWKVFVEDREGHFIVKINDPGRILYRRREWRKEKERMRMERKEQREAFLRRFEEGEQE